MTIGRKMAVALVASAGMIAGCSALGHSAATQASNGAAITADAGGLAPGPDVMDDAPDLTLADSHGGTFHLAEARKKGPVLIIFYLGYSCPRCVAHLRDIEANLDNIRATGAQVVAVSPDTVAKLKESEDAFGDFAFPMLADPDMTAAKAYGLVYGKDTLFHGCYIVDVEGHIAFAMKSSHPYDNTANLVSLLRSMEGDLPSHKGGAGKAGS